MSKEYSVVANIVANIEGFAKGMSEAKKKGEEFSKSFSDKTKNLSEGLNKVGQGMSKYVTVPLTAVAAGAAKVGADFEAAMSKVGAISGATGGDLKALEAKARDMGATTQFSASEAADALSYMAMAGWKTGDMLDGIDGIMNLAAASGEDLALTSDIVTDALTAFGLTAKDSGDFADILAAASSNANTNVAMLGESFKYAAPVAGALGYSAEDVSIALGLMANSGIKASQAGTSLRSMMTNLASPTTGMQEAMDALGISITDSTGEMKPFSEIMTDLRSKFSGLTKDQQAAYAATIFGKEAMSGALAVINASSDDFNNLSDAINNSEGSAKKMADVMKDNLSGRIKEMKSALEEAGISIFKNLQPALEKGVALIQSLADWFNNLSPTMQNTIIIIGGVALAIGPLLLVLAKIVSVIGTIAPLFATAGAAIGAISAPVLIAIGVITALIAIGVALYKNWDTVKEYSIKTWNAIADFFKKFWEATKILFNVAVEMISDLIKKNWEATKENTLNIFNSIKDFFGKWGTTILAVLTGPVGMLVLLITKNWDKISSTTTTVFNAIKNTASNIFNGIKDAISSIVSNISSTVTDKFNSMKSSVSNIINGIKSTATSVFNAVKDAITSPIDTAVSKVKSGLDRMQGFFSGLKLELPRIKLPHFSLKGSFSLNPPSVPSISVSWFKDGGIFNNPAIVGLAEAGKEAILPIQDRNAMKPFSDQVSRQIMDNFKQDKSDTANQGGVIHIQNLLSIGNLSPKASENLSNQDIDRLVDKSLDRLFTRMKAYGYRTGANPRIRG